jgi:hypothetical protein
MNEQSTDITEDFVTGPQDDGPSIEAAKNAAKFIINEINK